MCSPRSVRGGENITTAPQGPECLMFIGENKGMNSNYSNGLHNFLYNTWYQCVSFTGVLNQIVCKVREVIEHKGSSFVLIKFVPQDPPCVLF